MTVPEPVARIAELMSTFGPLWSLCGGWAIDAWLGYQNRYHDDIDIAVFEEDQRAIFQHLSGWQLVGHDGDVATHTDDPWDGRHLQVPAHVHAQSDDGLKLEVLLNERSKHEWVLRQEPRISKPLSQCVAPSPWELPTVVPEVLLFWKATAYLGDDTVGDRPQDQSDFLVLCPSLKEEQVAWLRDSISLVDSAHTWLGRFFQRKEGKLT